jgi:hypothetical protein
LLKVLLLPMALEKLMTRSYESHHTFPSDDTAAGLADDTSTNGHCVSGVEVSGGAITVSFDTTNANDSICQKTPVPYQ